MTTLIMDMAITMGIRTIPITIIRIRMSTIMENMQATTICEQPISMCWRTP